MTTCECSSAPHPESDNTSGLVAYLIAEELHVGTPSVFGDAGLAEISRPSLRRVVMRLDF